MSKIEEQMRQIIVGVVEAREQLARSEAECECLRSEVAFLRQVVGAGYERAYRPVSFATTDDDGNELKTPDQTRVAELEAAIERIGFRIIEGDFTLRAGETHHIYLEQIGE